MGKETAIDNMFYFVGKALGDRGAPIIKEPLSVLRCMMTVLENYKVMSEYHLFIFSALGLIEESEDGEIILSEYGRGFLESGANLFNQPSGNPEYFTEPR